MYETKARRLILRLILPTIFFLLMIIVKCSQGAVRCASTRPMNVGYVYDEDVQLLTLAANSPDALPGRRSPDASRSAQSYGQNRPPLQNVTGGRFTTNTQRDRIGRYSPQRTIQNGTAGAYYQESDSWNPIADEPTGRQFAPSAQYQNSTNTYQYPVQYNDDDEDDTKGLIQRLMESRRIPYNQKTRVPYASTQPISPPLDVDKNEPNEEYVETRTDAFSERDTLPDNYDEDSCPIETRETKSHQTDFPLSSTSAIISLPIGEFILYAAESPGRAIITYNLNCDNQDARGNEPLYTATANSCFQLKIVEDLLEKQRPVPLVICLAHGAFSSAFRVDYDQNQFRLQPCLQIIEHKYLTDVATVSAGRTGTLVAFSNNDFRPEAEFHETIAPIYIARGGQLFLCGYVDIQHTTDVALWHVQGKEYVVAYVQRIQPSRRTLLHFFEITIKNGNCHSIRPRKKQPLIGGQNYCGQRNTLCASEPFTIDQAICGVEDIQFLSSHEKYSDKSTHLAVAIANDVFEEGGIGCPNEELLCPTNARDKCFCACPHANHRSFVIAFNDKSKTFDFIKDHSASFQELTAGPESVTEITHLPTEKCCMVFQTTSPLGSTELYTIEKDQRGKMRVDQFYNSGLPQFVEKSSFGYCTSNDLIISYTLHSFQTDNTIYHLQCNKDRKKWSDNSYGNNERYANTDEGYSQRGYKKDISSGDLHDQKYYGNNSINNYPILGLENYGPSFNNRSSYTQSYYKYRPQTFSQSSASSYAGPRVPATHPEMNYGNFTYNALEPKQVFAQYTPINRTSAQQYNRPNQVKPFYSQPPSMLSQSNNQSPQTSSLLQPASVMYPDYPYRSPTQYPAASPPAPPTGGWPLNFNNGRAQPGPLYGTPAK